MSEFKPPTIKVDRYSVELLETGVFAPFFQISIETPMETSSETFTSEGEVRAFLRGLVTAYAFAGVHVSEPEIPRGETKRFTILEFDDD